MCGCDFDDKLGICRNKYPDCPALTGTVIARTDLVSTLYTPQSSLCTTDFLSLSASAWVSYSVAFYTYCLQPPSLPPSSPHLTTISFHLKHPLHSALTLLLLFLTPDEGQNFGAGFYNDHHFHFGYHIYAAAGNAILVVNDLSYFIFITSYFILSCLHLREVMTLSIFQSCHSYLYLSLHCLQQVEHGASQTNVILVLSVAAKFDNNWGRKFHERVLLLVRDIANPSGDDPFFPAWRHKDW